MEVKTETRGHVLVITLDRPAARNAINGAVAAGIEAAIDKLEGDDDLWVGIIQSSGTVFCAGADLKEVSAGNGRALSTERGGFAGLVKRERTKPLIAAVNGAAVAGGCEIVLSCDMVIAADGARFGLPEVKRSLAAAAGGLFRLPRHIGEARAMEMILTGRFVDAAEAEAIGLITQVIEGDLMAGAMAFAETFSGYSLAALKLAREATRRALDVSLDEGLKIEADLNTLSFRLDDAAEGAAAFLEKRQPTFQDR